MLVFQDMPDQMYMSKATIHANINFFENKDWIRILSIGFISTIIIILSYLAPYLIKIIQLNMQELLHCIISSSKREFLQWLLPNARLESQILLYFLHC